MEKLNMVSSNRKSAIHRLFSTFSGSFLEIRQRWLAVILAVTLMLGINLPAIAANPQSLTAQNRAIALELATAGWGTNPNWEKTWDKLISPKVVQHFNSAPEPIVGLAANKEFSKSLFQGFPDIQQKIEDVIAEGNIVVYRTTIQGTNTGEFLGAPATGKAIKVNDFTLLRIANGQIIEMWYETNLLEVMQQLGIIPRNA
jgi:predicted ester cyclase